MTTEIAVADMTIGGEAAAAMTAMTEAATDMTTDQGFDKQQISISFFSV